MSDVNIFTTKLMSFLISDCAVGSRFPMAAFIGQLDYAESFTADDIQTAFDTLVRNGYLEEIDNVDYRVLSKPL